MRLIAWIWVCVLGTTAVAQEPRRNPFRDPPPAPASPASPGLGGSGTAAADAPTPAGRTRSAPRVVRAAEAGIGRLVPDVAFTDLAGRPGKLSDFQTAKLIVVAFTNTTCPLCKKYAPVLARLEKEYAARGVAFLFVNPTAGDTPAQGQFAGRYVHDTAGTLTAALGATSTTEVFVLDPTQTLLYRGAVDDQYGLGYAREAPRYQYLRAALDDALAGRPVAVAATTAPGCELDPASTPAPAVPLTYHARIERLVQAHCIECHRSGGVAPFALETYEQVVAHKGAIRRVVDDRTMPPWFAAPPPAGRPSPFANDRSLTETDRADLLAWLSGDLKKGNPADAPLPRSFASGWLIGSPDAVFQISRPIRVKAEGTMPYQLVRIETDYPEDRWVQALEIQPTARDVVHHVLVFAIPPTQRGPGSEACGFFAAYAPGNGVLVYPEGYAKRLPKGYTLLFQIHYTPNGRATTDQTRLGIVFARRPPQYEVHTFGIANLTFTLPPHTAETRVAAKAGVLDGDIAIVGLFPHAHLRGKAARYELTVAGRTRTLLDVPRYDFNWQLPYHFAEPVLAPKGSVITYTAWYDNSSGNPANPDPDQEVGWGEQTTDEMHLGYVDYVSLGGGRLGLPPRPADFHFPPQGVAIPKFARAALQAADANGNGVLEPAEFRRLPPAVQEKVLDFVWRVSPAGTDP